MVTPARAHRAGRRLIVTLAVLTVAVSGLAAPAPATPSAGPDPQAVPVATAPGGASYQVTLVTGDVVELVVAPDGRQLASLAEGAADPGTADIIERDGDVYVYPEEARPYLASGALDERLFNVTYLATEGYHDAAMDELPLLVEAPDSAVRTLDAAGAEVVRSLPGAGMESVAADKDALAGFWEELRGPVPDGPTTASGEAELAGADRVWLNGRVRAMLGDSVPHVGAPAAWDAGWDGSGITVAVLDTGYDPDHPDLAGQVVASENFTWDESVVDGHGHGTHVAATVAGTGAASDGTRTGVAPGADLMIGKVLDSNGSGFDDWIMAGMEWAAAEGADVVNMSLGTLFASNGNHPLDLAVNRLTEETGTLFVASAGNDGPAERTVTAPAAATSALAVGASTKDDQAAAFSSRGPRLGDGRIKPELVAPGVDIVAARAAGTSLGNLIDENYTSLNGTSMAAPHVAGAAALLAQQHPDWSPGELSAALTTTTHGLPGQPVTYQGAGRLDAAAAVSVPVLASHGSLSFGEVPRDAGHESRTVSYRNLTDRTVVVQLSAELESTGASDHRPRMLLRRPVLVIRPGQTESAEVILMTRGTRPGGYAGHLLATVRGQGGPAGQLRTALSVAVERPVWRVETSAVNRQGGPATGGFWMWNLDTGELFNSGIFAGQASIEVPAGRYTQLISVQDRDDSFGQISHTAGGDPELIVDGDLALHYDARDAQRLAVQTPRETVTRSFDLRWHRAVGDRSISFSLGQSGQLGIELYTWGGPPARTGTFEVTSQWQLAEPALTLAGPDGPRIHPELGSASEPFVGDVSLPLVYAGLGRPEDFTEADVAGKLALVTRDGDGNVANQVAAAAAAGAEMLLIHGTGEGAWNENVFNVGLPYYTTNLSTGQRLREALALDPELRLDLRGIPDATYSYQLAIREDRIPAGRTYRAEDLPLATVESQYRELSDRMFGREAWVPSLAAGLSNRIALDRSGPVTRTEYINTDVPWLRFALPHQHVGFTVYITWSELTTYQAGETYHELWWGPMAVPGVVAIPGAERFGAPVSRFHDAIRIIMSHYLYDHGRLNGDIWEGFGDVSRLTLRRDGTLVGEATWPEAQFTVPPEGAAHTLGLEVTSGSDHFSDLSTRTVSTWQFSSGRPEGDSEVLPLLQLGYDLPGADLHNRVAPGTPYQLLIDPGYQPGASGPAGFTATVLVSYDGGATWTAAPVTQEEGGLLAAAVPAAPAGAGYASVRVVATDADGNRLTQRVERAWRIG